MKNQFAVNCDNSYSQSECFNFGTFLLTRLRQFNDEIALIDSSSNEKLSYKQLLDYSINLSISLLNLGIKKGEIVAFCSEKRQDFLPTAIAIIMTGATYTPIYANCGSVVLLHKLKLSKPKFLICSGTFWKINVDALNALEFIETAISLDDSIDGTIKSIKSIKNPFDIDAFEPAKSVGHDDVAMILYSSGTTGMPKGVMLHNKACVLNSLGHDFKEHLQAVWVSGDWYHNYDFFVSISNLCYGRTLIWHGIDDLMAEAILKAVNDLKVDIIVAVPSIISTLAETNPAIIEKYSLNSFKHIYSSSAKLSRQLIEQFNKKFPNVTVFQRYGMTEVGPVSSERLSALGPKPGSIGVPFPGVTLKVVHTQTQKVVGLKEIGELCVKSPTSMKGYFGDTNAKISSDEDGFLRTGDLAYYDEDNYFFIVDRIKEIINYDGYQVPPFQLETILLSHPDVSDAGVVGKPDPVFNELPAAFVVKKTGSKVTEKELQEFVAAEVCDYMQLRGGVKFISEIPRSATRKILRRHLRELLQN